MTQRALYNCAHIRPLAVRPLPHSESVPNPWGFLMSGLRVLEVA